MTQLELLLRPSPVILDVASEKAKHLFTFFTSYIMEPINRTDTTATLGQPTSPNRLEIPDQVRLSTDSLRRAFRTSVSDMCSSPLGPSLTRTDIQTSAADFSIFPEYKLQYPSVVTAALGELYREYNRSFGPLVEANREWDTDYQYCLRGPGGTPINYFVQIDMNGLQPDFLDIAGAMDQESVVRILRENIFEIENSVAWYHMLSQLHEQDGTDSRFKTVFRESLDQLRQFFGRPIALLATTEDKLEAMKATEFGRRPDEELSQADVRDLTGFDALMGPKEFQEHVRSNGNESDFLLYVRSSEPVAKLRDPRIEVEQPLLGDETMRRLIKANTLTMNIDGPRMSDSQRINDTKEYMPQMDMGVLFSQDTGLMTDEFVAFLRNRKPADAFQGEQVFSDNVTRFLVERALDPEQIRTGQVPLHVKPAIASYGCYGHFAGTVLKKSFRERLRKELKRRGSYIAQPQLQNPTTQNTFDQSTFTFIDRVFMTCLPTSPESPGFMSGNRSFLPLESDEAKRGRNHGTNDTRYAEILGS